MYGSLISNISQPFHSSLVLSPPSISLSHYHSHLPCLVVLLLNLFPSHPLTSLPPPQSTHSHVSRPLLIYAHFHRFLHHLPIHSSFPHFPSSINLPHMLPSTIYAHSHISPSINPPITPTHPSLQFNPPSSYPPLTPTHPSLHQTTHNSHLPILSSPLAVVGSSWAYGLLAHFLAVFSATLSHPSLSIPRTYKTLHGGGVSSPLL